MGKKFLYFYILLFVALFIFGGFFVGDKNRNKIIVGLAPTPVISQTGNKSSAKVVYVVDGDTIKVLISGKEDIVRLIGIDSPEILDERKPVQCFGKEASVEAREMLTGKIVSLESDSTQKNRDEYGRLLRYVFLNNLNINKFMIDEGYAREYTFKGNPYERQLEFIQAEKNAEKEKKGLWGSCLR